MSEQSHEKQLPALSLELDSEPLEINSAIQEILAPLDTDQKEPLDTPGHTDQEEPLDTSGHTDQEEQTDRIQEQELTGHTESAQPYSASNYYNSAASDSVRRTPSLNSTNASYLNEQGRYQRYGGVRNSDSIRKHEQLIEEGSESDIYLQSHRWHSSTSSSPKRQEFSSSPRERGLLEYPSDVNSQQARSSSESSDNPLTSKQFYRSKSPLSDGPSRRSSERYRGEAYANQMSSSYNKKKEKREHSHRKKPRSEHAYRSVRVPSRIKTPTSNSMPIDDNDEFIVNAAPAAVDQASESLDRSRRHRALIRPERARYTRTHSSSGKESTQPLSDRPVKEKVSREMCIDIKNGECPSVWVLFSIIMTFWAPPACLQCCGMRDKRVQQAWREKIALVFIIIILCIVVGFLTFGFTQTVCRQTTGNFAAGTTPVYAATVHGRIFDIGSYVHPVIPGMVPTSYLLANPPAAGRKDLSFMFQSLDHDNCDSIFATLPNAYYFPCLPIEDIATTKNVNDYTQIGCHTDDSARIALSKLPFLGTVFFSWQDVQDINRNFTVYNGQVLDLDRLGLLLKGTRTSNLLQETIRFNALHGRDVTYLLSQTKATTKLANCLVNTIRVGIVDVNSLGCVITDIVLYVSLVFIVGVVLVRFVLAMLFGWVLSWRLGNFKEVTFVERRKRQEMIEKWSSDPNSTITYSNKRTGFLSTSRFTPKQTIPPAGIDGVGRHYRARRNTNSSATGRSSSEFGDARRSPSIAPIRSSSSSTTVSRAGSIKGVQPNQSDSEVPNPAMHLPTNSFNNSPDIDVRYNFRLMHTIMLVACYSEGINGLRTTLDSLAATDYPHSHKLVLCIADGLITGEGNDKSTPDTLLSLMRDFIVPPHEVVAHSYVAIADGSKRHNMAKVYAGYYKYDNEFDPYGRNQVPMITIVKTGGPGEEDDKKPGNRGKRDSQVILMSFLNNVISDDRMTALEYELFNMIWAVTGVTPDVFEVVLNVDADTKVFPDSLTKMVACMAKDPNIVGLCGETKIANKSDTWVTMIQVFEYYISHHLQKAFESIFGGVTCLPGCFSMYRIKAPKGSGYWVPILANSDIVNQYAENVVDTLHKKNLLLLGEDRYLSTLMLRTFPKRKMMFVPQAVCKTIVPDSFAVLKSQRRRWINSTVHNLLELVFVPNLCGTFCFSMQFVIFMELVGTVVLPAAICFTGFLIIISFVQTPIPLIPLLLLGAVLGLPAVLILMTTRKIIYVCWMAIYLCSLPIWNFVLPVYAFWHFDDFSWGHTRVVKGDDVGGAYGWKEGEFDSRQIVMKQWSEWERDRLYRVRQLNKSTRSFGHSQRSSSQDTRHSGSGITPLEPAHVYPPTGLTRSNRSSIRSYKG